MALFTKSSGTPSFLSWGLTQRQYHRARFNLCNCSTDSGAIVPSW